MVKKNKNKNGNGNRNGNGKVTDRNKSLLGQNAILLQR